MVQPDLPPEVGAGDHTESRRTKWQREHRAKRRVCNATLSPSPCITLSSAGKQEQ